MARRIVGGLSVTGLEETIAAASAAEKDVKQAVVREIRKELRPLANDIRQRFRDLGGTGARVATTVRVSTGGQSAKVSMGSAKHPYSLGREFGAKRNVTRPFFRRVQSGAFATRRVGGGERRVTRARIPYAKDTIFGAWTGNQFQLGESGDRLVIEQESGRAFYPGIGSGAQNVFERLKKVADKYADSFPAATGAGAPAGPSSLERLEAYLKGGGIGG